MSSVPDKDKHGERIQQKEKKLARKMRLAKEYGYDHVLKEPHKYHERSVFRCANPHCFMCANPRKSMKEKTMQERKFEQKERYEGKEPESDM